MQNTAQKISHVCKLCGKMYAQEILLQEHLRMHIEEESACDSCGKPYSSLGLYLRTHTGETPYECDICCRKFSKRPILENHRRTHIREKLFACDVCGKAFSHNSNLWEHKRSHTGEEPVDCSVCSMNFSNCDLYVKLLQTHKGGDPRANDVGDNAFTQSSTQLVHVCDICSKVFPELHLLLAHQITHPGRKPKFYKCGKCYKAFHRRSALLVHRRTHSR